MCNPELVSQYAGGASSTGAHPGFPGGPPDGWIIPTAAQSDSRVRQTDANSRGDLLRQQKGHPAPGISTPMWNELTESDAQKMDQTPYRMGGSNYPRDSYSGGSDLLNINQFAADKAKRPIR